MSDLASVIRYVQALDTSVTDGSGKTGLAFSDVTAKYLTKGGTLTALTTETISTLGTYQAPSDAAHIRIKELANADPTKGIYEVHFHNTQVVASSVELWLFLSATGARFQPLELRLADLTLVAADAAASAASALSADNKASTIVTATAAAAIRADLGLGSANLDTQLAAIAGYIDTEVATANTNIAAIQTTLGAAGAGLTGIPKTGYKLAADGWDAVIIEASIIASANLTDDANSQLTAINARQAQALILSACAAVLAGAATTEVTMKQAGKPAGNTRIDATVDSNGNRSAVTLKVPT
jgi:hypothetical protein